MSMLYTQQLNNFHATEAASDEELLAAIML